MLNKIINVLRRKMVRYFRTKFSSIQSFTSQPKLTTEPNSMAVIMPNHWLLCKYMCFGSSSKLLFVHLFVSPPAWKSTFILHAKRKSLQRTKELRWNALQGAFYYRTTNGISLSILLFHSIGLFHSQFPLVCFHHHQMCYCCCHYFFFANIWNWITHENTIDK